jgi:hypothetical protein
MIRDALGTSVLKDLRPLNSVLRCIRKPLETETQSFFMFNVKMRTFFIKCGRFL